MVNDNRGSFGGSFRIIETDETWKGNPVYSSNDNDKFSIVNGQCVKVPSDYEIALEEFDKKFPTERTK